MNTKYRGDKDRKPDSETHISDAWSDEPAEVITIRSFGVGSEPVLPSEVSEADVEMATELGEHLNDYLTAKATGANLIKKWVDIATSSYPTQDLLITDKGTNHVTNNEETPTSAGPGRPSIVKFPAKEQGIESITALITVLTKKTEDLDAQHAEQLRQQKASNAVLDDKLKRTEQLMQELQSTKKRIEEERDEANSRHKGVTLELEQAERDRKALETQLETAKSNITAAQAAHRRAIARTWAISIISLLVVAAIIIAETVFKVF
jgi:hypothetical protein